MSRGGGSGAMEEIQDQLEQLERQREAIEREVRSLQQEQTDIDDAIEAVDTLEDGATVQVPLGGGAYVPAEVQQMDEVVVSLGGGYAAEQDQPGAIEVLETKRSRLDEDIADLQSQREQVESETQQLEQQAQQMQQQQMQQLQQQMGQQPEDDG